MESEFQGKQVRHVLPTSEKPLSGKSDHRPRLLLVEDEAMIAIGEQRMLESCGYQVVVAGTGEEALEICNSEPEIDLILMDIQLGAGRLSGPETAMQILKTRQLPVIFLSGHTDPEVVAQTQKISAYGYVDKSSNGTTLDASIKMALRLFQANARLEEERSHLQTTLNSIGDAVIATDAAGRITRINLIAQRLTGWTLEDALGKPVQDVANITNVQAGLSRKHPVHAVLGCSGVVGRSRSSSLRAKDGAVHPIEDYAAPIKDSVGKIMGAILVFRDITEELRLQDDRRHQNDVIEESQRAANIGSYRGDFTRNTWEISVEMKRIFGIDDSTPVNLTNCLALIYPEDQEMVRRHMQEEVIDQRKPFDKECRILRESDGEIRWVHGLGAVTFDPAGIPLTMIGTIQDITERKEMAANLRAIQEQITLFIRHSPIHAYLKEVTERESRVLFASESFVDLIGIPGSQISGKTMEELFPLEFAAKITRDDWAVVSDNQILTLDEEFNGRHYSTIKFPITQGGAKLLAGYSIEITERKRAEEKLSIKNVVFDVSLAANSIADKEGNLQEVNDSFLKIWGCSHKEDVIGKPIADFFDDPSVASHILSVLNETGNWEGEFLAKRDGGEDFVVHALATALNDKQGRLIGYQSSVIDVTEQKQAEARIKALLDVKERLLEEVHHRIKNVLYSINSLLILQASAESGADGRVTLLEAANRVQSMMMLYERLQKSSDYLSVFSQSYLSSLAVAIVASFTGNVPVTLEKSIENCLLSAEKCQPLGLILNELLTNAMRHAFVGKASGKVAVTFRVDEGRAVLVVHDDGLGLPGSIDFENSPSLGLRLVHVLSRQIGGTVRAERGNGAKVIVEFPSSGVCDESG